MDMGEGYISNRHDMRTVPTLGVVIMYFFFKFEYVPGWMPLYNQFEDLFVKKIQFSHGAIGFKNHEKSLKIAL